jgi:hypothetical protein
MTLHHPHYPGGLGADEFARFATFPILPATYTVKDDPRLWRASVTKPTIDVMLTGSNPFPMTNDDGLRASVRELVTESRVAAGKKRSRIMRSKLWLIPAIGAGGLALTAGALVTNNMLFPDLPIRIEYTTDTGTSVSCTAQIEGGSMFEANSDAVVKYFRGRDLSGIGQQIYNHTLVLTGDAKATPENTPKSNVWIPGEGNWLSDESAFSMSLVDYLVINTQIDLDLKGDGGWLTSDCTGQLH